MKESGCGVNIFKSCVKLGRSGCGWRLGVEIVKQAAYITLFQL